MSRRADPRSRQHDDRRGQRGASGPGRRDVEHRFTEEEWLTPMQIARKLGYATDKPIRNAIRSGELKASHAPCRRKLIVAESEVLRWIDEDLAYEPMTPELESPAAPSPPRKATTRTASRMPALQYDPTHLDQP